ncbi:MAG: HAD family hydrolase [Candidatus Melainabacteria bacterium]|nr:HAD family hydrolase [Candidatus Melainabacteria bacterium]
MELTAEIPNKLDTSSHQSWLTGAVEDAYANPGLKQVADKSSSVGEFAQEHWKEIAGVGLTLLAGTAFVAGRKYGLGPLANLLKGGEAAVGLEKGGAVAEGAIARLRNVDHFVFDMDRTLVNHDGALKVLQTTMTDGLTKSSGLSREFISDALKQTTTRLDSPYFWNRLDEIKPLQEHFPGVNLNHRFADVASNARQAYHDALKAKPETVELLNYIRSQGKGVHVFTASNPARALDKLNAAGLLDRVDRIYVAGANAFEDSGAAGLMTKQAYSGKLFALPNTAKADSSGYAFISQDLRTKGSRLAMTGDHAVEDIANAKAHNYFTAKANWYRQMPDAVTPDLQFTSPSQFTSLLKSKIF